MKSDFEIMPPTVLAQAVDEHKQYLQDYPEKRVICDDTITPFSRAMKSLGYATRMTHSRGCSILRTCPNEDCKEVYSTGYTKESVDYWGCPHCKRISNS